MTAATALASLLLHIVALVFAAVIGSATEKNEDGMVQLATILSVGLMMIAWALALGWLS